MYFFSAELGLQTDFFKTKIPQIWHWLASENSFDFFYSWEVYTILKIDFKYQYQNESESKAQLG